MVEYLLLEHHISLGAQCFISLLLLVLLIFISIEMTEQEVKINGNEGIPEKPMLHRKTYIFSARQSCLNPLDDDTCSIRTLFSFLIYKVEKYFIFRLKQFPISNRLFKKYQYRYFSMESKISWELKEIDEEYIVVEKKEA